MTATRWTQDNRYIVWTVGDYDNHYNLYVGGYLVAENLPWDKWYELYQSFVNLKKEAA